MLRIWSIFPPWVFRKLPRKSARETIMSTPTVPISEASHRLLQELAQRTGQSLIATLDQALDAYRRKVFFEEMDAGYAALRADPKAWADAEAERKLWDVTLMDGLNSNERWTEDGCCPNSSE
jgi:hypothetical protein